MSVLEAPVRSIQVDRIIRTDLLIEPVRISNSPVRQADQKIDLVNISVAWLPISQAEITYDLVTHLSNGVFANEIAVGEIYGANGWDDEDKTNPSPAALINDLLLPRDPEPPVPIPSEYTSQLLSQNVVIERSPPTVATLGELLNAAISVITMDTPSLGLFHIIELSAGLIILGAAVGISLGLQRGLARAIEQAISQKKRTSPKDPRNNKP